MVSSTELRTPTVPSPHCPPRTITELISRRAKDLPDEPILGYPSNGTEYEEYTFSQLDALSAKAASIYAKQLPLRTSSQDAERVVAILGTSNLDYVIALLALSRLGFTVLFLSTRISEAAYLSLLDATECSHILTSPSFQPIATSVAGQASRLEIISILEKEQYASGSSPPPEEDSVSKFDLDIETDKISWIIHSSGSTGLPKPIYQTHHAALRNYEQNMNMKGFITLPLFHAHGLSSTFRAITSVKKIYLYSASLPLTRQNLLDTMHKHKFEIFYGVPYALKLLSETKEGVGALAAMKVVMFGGSACPDALGDLLVEGGVNLISHYGTTETGQLMTSFRASADGAWNYVRVHDKLEPYVRFEERGGNLYELVVLDGWPSKVASNRPDGAYATKDVFEPHPSIDKAWKYNSRLDDTIVLMNGEKAIPIAMEQAVRQNELIREAMVFGTGKAQLAMIVVASDNAARMQPQELIGRIWPIVEAENKDSPAYAQLTQAMVRVLPAGTEYPQTGKGTAIRQAFYRAFAEQIETIYKHAEASSAGTLFLSELELCSWLREQITKLLAPEEAKSLANDTDLFSLGVDSLQSARLRAAILQEVQLSGHTLPQNVVFECPTISKLAAELLRIRDSRAADVKDVTTEMAELVIKYGTFPKHVPNQRATSENCIVVTGATGSLGAHLVAQLVVRNDISEVCCLVRASSNTSARRRVIQSMQKRGVHHALPLTARRKITCYPSDFSRTKLGFDEASYSLLSRRITALIHCAWSVNFNKSLSSFEADCIAGAKNLMLLCLSAQQIRPASFNFCSSVSTVAATPGDLVYDVLPHDFSCAQGMGYAQSKLVTEHLVVKAAQDTDIQARVLRVGQIVADTKHGIWNETEAIPLMLQSATTFGALPKLDESPRWLPVDVVATTVMDVSLSSTTQQIFNVVNPNTFHWTRDLLPALRSAGLSFEEVGQREWIKRLRASDPDPTANPTIKLLEFFASKYDNDVTKTKTLGYDTAAAQSLSSALTSVPKLSPHLVSKFVKHFLATSWSPRNAPIPTPKTRLLIVSGPAGAGKSTIASALAARLDCASIEGDAVHDAVAITKMSNGIALSSLDRHIWLARIKIEILERVRATQMLRDSAAIAMPLNTSNPETIVLTCSALKRDNRDALRDMLGDGSIETRFVVLQASEEELVRRVGERKGHYMKADMVASQLAAVEDPAEDEVDMLPVDAEEAQMEVVEEICAALC